MPNKMLIDASHPEETRVVVVRGNRIEEFDFESQDKKQLKGNIYLARVTRVEPSLQAAFVEYGGNRHGFLAFSEIHPDYYQIPIADRQALLRAEAEDDENEDDEETDAEERGERGRGRRRRRGGRHRGREERQAATGEASDGESAEIEAADGDVETATATTDVDDDVETTAGAHPASNSDADLTGKQQHAYAEAELVTVDEAPAEAEAAEPEAATVEEGQPTTGDVGPDEATAGAEGKIVEEDRRSGSIAAAVDADVVSEAVEVVAEELKEAPSEGDTVVTHNESGGTIEEVPSSHADENEVESVGAEDALEEVRNRRRPVRRNYKIQEVIKRRQILLVQVVKEERGNKGAALTTYLSLAGRYSVLMPNTARGGGISRKITNAQDRKRLKEVVADLDVPQGMGVILRTAGESRTKAEIKRDYEYLMRLWETVRSLTLQSTAPALVYEEGSLIKRSVRDLYNKDIDEVLVAGEEGYREAKDFMRMLMPSHAKVVQPYRDTVPIFARAGLEAQLDRMLQPQVTLKSGGYIIINQTEALVSIDVNSGRSTKEHSIEDTALQTNLEAAEEVARQLRLRDLAGLIVIDFIDMEENRNNRAVEKRLKDCLKNDRARIQVGRISHFGLLEMSRQRIRASVLESTMKPCPHCGGTGHVRSDFSVALHVVRAIEEFLLKDARNHITVKTPTATALYVLNHKRSTLVEMERRFGVAISLEADESLGAQPYLIVRGAVAEKSVSVEEEVPTAASPAPDYDDDAEDDVAEEANTEAAAERGEDEGNGQAGEHQNRDRKRRRRRRRRPGDRENDVSVTDEAGHEAEAFAGDSDDDDDGLVPVDEDQPAGERTDGGHRKRRRGKRGGRRNRPNEDGVQTASDPLDGEAETGAMADVAMADVTPSDAGSEDEGPGAHEMRVGEPDRDTEPAAESEIPAEVPAAAASEPAAETTGHGESAANGEDESARIHRTRRRPGSEALASTQPVVVSSDGTPEESKPKKGGWWQRKGFF